MIDVSAVAPALQRDQLAALAADCIGPHEARMIVIGRAHDLCEDFVCGRHLHTTIRCGSRAGPNDLGEFGIFCDRSDTSAHKHYMEDDQDDWEWRLAAARAAAEAECEPEPQDEEDWEWQIAVARARGSATDLAQGSGTDVMRGVRLDTPRPARRTPPPPPRPKSSTQPLGSAAPRTIIAVPALPNVDPQLVRSYVRPPRR
jgi:hypothetical protein